MIYRKLKKCPNIFLKIASLHNHAPDSNLKVLSYYAVIQFHCKNYTKMNQRLIWSLLKEAVHISSEPKFVIL